MNEEIVVVIGREMEELIPGFLANRRQDVVRIRTALAAGDFDAVRFAGHGLKGLGSTYGFEALSALGEQLEEAALAENEGAIARALAEITGYLERVRVVFE